MDDRNAVKVTDPFAASGLPLGGMGESLFVINLCAANMPQSIDAASVRDWGIHGLDTFKLYQVSRIEEGRRRYRVRLGFFTSESDAEAVLKIVRGKFASAFTSGLCDEDLKQASSYLKKPLEELREIQDIQRTGRFRAPKFPAEMLEQFNDASTSPQPNSVRPSIARAASAVLSEGPAAKHSEPVVEFELTPQRPAKPKSEPKAVVATNNANVTALKSAAKIEPLQLSASTPPVSATRRVTPSNEQFHVGAGRTIADSGLSLAQEKPGASKPFSKQAELPRPLVSAEALAKLRAGAQPRQASTVIPTLDSTQTIRTLTKKEVEDANAPKWFVVQLAISDQPANLDTMPRLDIFEAYRLYSVAVMRNNVIRHALRLGFFTEQVSAEAVMGYVKTFFGEPTIERVSDAEQNRFIAPPPAKTSAPDVKTQSRVITLEEKRPLTPLAPPVAPSPSAAKTANNSAASAIKPAIKRSPPLASKKNASKARKPISKGELNEARMLGLSDTAIRRVERNPSLLSRLVDKLTK